MTNSEFILLNQWVGTLRFCHLKASVCTWKNQFVPSWNESQLLFSVDPWELERDNRLDCTTGEKAHMHTHLCIYVYIHAPVYMYIRTHTYIHHSCYLLMILVSWVTQTTDKQTNKQMKIQSKSRNLAKRAFYSI